MIKVNYNTETTLVQGYYPDSINYASIPEPYIEIEENQQINDKQMCVVKGIYQEYVKPLDVQLEEAKDAKIAQCKAYLLKTDWQVVRFAETAVAVNETVLANRSLARSLQNDIARQDITLEELKNININF